MGKISDYTRVLLSKLTDVLVVDQTDNGTTETKSATVEQIGTAIGKLQNFADLDTSNKTLVDSINEIASYTPVYNNTASGAIATFDTSLALPLQDLQIAINAGQESGTPTPQDSKAISGFTGANIAVRGKNLIDVTKYTTGILSNGSITSTTSSTIANKQSGSVTFTTTATWAGITIPDYMLVDDSKVTISYAYSGTSTVWLIVEYYDESENYLSRSAVQATASGTTFTIPSGCVYVRMSFQMSTATTATISNIQMEQGSTATTYEAYNGTIYPITWQSEAGTVYGGLLDVTSGVLTVTHGIITFDGSGDEIWNDGTIRYSIEIADCKRTAGRLEVLCNRGVYASSGGSEETVFVTNTYFYYYQPTSITSLADFKTWLGSNNLVVVYPLATPTTYQLTPTQISAIVGTNNVFTDTNGNTSVVYACSLKDYIDGQ